MGRQGFPDAGVGFSDGSGFVGIKQNQDQIGDAGQFADRILVAVSSVSFGDAVEHTRGIDEGQIFQKRGIHLFKAQVGGKTLAIFFQAFEGIFRIIEQKFSIPLFHYMHGICAVLGGAPVNHRKGVIRGSLAGTAGRLTNGSKQDMRYLDLIENQQENLKKAILQAPHHRLDNLATFIETHGERLTHMTEALFNYRRQWRKFVIKFGFLGLLSGLGTGAAAAFGIGAYLGLPDQVILSVAGGGTALAVFFIWMTFLKKKFSARFLRRQLKNPDKLTSLDNQARRDSWNSIRDIVLAYLEKTGGVYSLGDTEYDYFSVKKVFERGTREIREALNELTTIRHGDSQLKENDDNVDAQDPVYSPGPRFIKTPVKIQDEEISEKDPYK